MKMWLLTQDIHYESDEVLGVFTTKQRALDAFYSLDEKDWTEREFGIVMTERSPKFEKFQYVGVTYWIVEIEVDQLPPNNALGW